MGTWGIWRRLRRHYRGGFRRAVASVKSWSSLSDSLSNQLLSHFSPSSILVFVNYRTHTCICQLPDAYLYLSAGCLLVFVIRPHTCICSNSACWALFLKSSDHASPEIHS